MEKYSWNKKMLIPLLKGGILKLSMPSLVFKYYCLTFPLFLSLNDDVN